MINEYVYAYCICIIYTCHYVIYIYIYSVLNYIFAHEASEYGKYWFRAQSRVKEAVGSFHL